MKRLMLLVLGLLALTACPPATTSDSNKVDVQPGSNSVVPGQSYDFNHAFAAALACDASTLVWSLQEPGTPPGDGKIAAGVFTAPSCGSVYVGTQMHIQAFCPANGKTGVAVVSVAQEQLQNLTLPWVIRSPGTANACVDSTPPFEVDPGGELQFYAELVYTCQTITVPTPPNPLPPACP